MTNDLLDWDGITELFKQRCVNLMGRIDDGSDVFCRNDDASAARRSSLADLYAITRYFYLDVLVDTVRRCTLAVFMGSIDTVCR